MNAPEYALWFAWLGLTALSSSALIVLASLLARRLPSAAAQRSLWRAVVVGLALLLLAESTGVADWLMEAASGLARSESVPQGGALAPRVGTLSRSESATVEPVMNTDNLPPLEAEDALPERFEAEVSGVWWPGALWLAGALIFLARGFLGRALLIAFRLRHPRSENTSLIERVHMIAARLGYRRRVRVMEVPRLCGPAAFGIVRPTVAVPADFTSQFDAPRQEVMLAHELAHLAAHDPAWLLLADLVVALLWWQPLAWWARRQLRAAGEAAADEASLVVADGPELLAACLIELGKRLAAPERAGWLGMAGNGFRSGLGRRVERLLRLRPRNWRPPGLRLRLGLLLAVVILWICAVLSTAWVRSQAIEEGDVPMRTLQRSWRRSLAATFLMAALAPANDAAPADEPAAPPATRTREPRESPESDQKIQQLKTKIIDLDVQRAALRQRAAGDTKPIKELDEQINRLEEQKQRLLGEQQHKTLMQKQIRVFRLKHVKPEEVREALESLLGAPTGRPMAGGMGLMMPGMPSVGGKMSPMMPGGPGMPGVGGPSTMDRMRGSGGKNPMRGGISGMGPTEHAPPDWRLTVDVRTRSIIIRASRLDVRRAADVIALLDMPGGKALPKVKDMQAFKLKHASAAKIAEILGELDLDARVLALERTNRVIIAGNEAAVKEAAELIEQLDVEAKDGESQNGKFDPFHP